MSAHTILAGLAGGGGAIVLIGLSLGMSSCQNRAPNDTGVDEVLLDGLGHGVQRVHGTLIAGSLVRETSPCAYRFAMEKNGRRMPVRYASCVVSDAFAAATADGEATPVVVEGELTAEGFVATSVLTFVPNCCFCSAETRARQLRKWRESGHVE